MNLNVQMILKLSETDKTKGIVLNNKQKGEQQMLFDNDELVTTGGRFLSKY